MKQQGYSRCPPVSLSEPLAQHRYHTNSYKSTMNVLLLTVKVPADPLCDQCRHGELDSSCSWMVSSAYQLHMAVPATMRGISLSVVSVSLSPTYQVVSRVLRTGMEKDTSDDEVQEQYTLIYYIVALHCFFFS